MDEIWKPVVGLEDKYEVSNYGAVRNKNKKLKQNINKCGYCQICLRSNGRSSQKLVHRLVAIAFIENNENLNFVNHLDGDKTNNHSANLEWVTIRDNANHHISLFKKNGLPSGVSKTANGKYKSQVSHNNKKICLGTFIDVNDAHTAYTEFLKKIGHESIYIRNTETDIIKKYKPRKIKPKDEKEIIDLYNNMKSLEEISKIFKCSLECIRHVLIRNNVERRQASVNIRWYEK